MAQRVKCLLCTWSQVQIHSSHENCQAWLNTPVATVLPKLRQEACGAMLVD